MNKPCVLDALVFLYLHRVAYYFNLKWQLNQLRVAPPPPMRDKQHLSTVMNHTAQWTSVRVDVTTFGQRTDSKNERDVDL